MDNVYYKGELIPAKDWDYETKKPKVKEPKSKKTEVVAEPVVEVEINESFIDSLKD